MRTTLAAVVLAIVVMAYLREPAWLAGVESGLRGWETGRDGVRARSTDGHASFFVPSASAIVIVPLRTTFDETADAPVRVRFTIDDRPAADLLLSDARWQHATLHLPEPGQRRLRRIDIRVDHVRPGNRGVLLGEISLEQKAAGSRELR